VQGLLLFNTVQSDSHSWGTPLEHLCLCEGVKRHYHVVRDTCTLHEAAPAHQEPRFPEKCLKYVRLSVL
jgi:hypothetical protein